MNSFDTDGKIFDLGGYHDWGNDYSLVHSNTFDKIASTDSTPEELLRVAEQLKSRPDGRYLLLNALGAHEAWGHNRNGDAFPEWSLKAMAPPKSVADYIESRVRTKYPQIVIPPREAYGHHTFPRFAHVYNYHQNTDPAKSIGDVIASAFNDKMKRVEVIVFVRTKHAPDVVKMIDDGVPIPWSMGAKLPYDRCFPAGTLVRTASGYRPIEDITEGEDVVTLGGKLAPVDVAIQSSFSGELLTIKPHGLPEFQTTDNHPVFVLKREDVRSCQGVTRRHTGSDSCNTCGDDLSWETHEVRADEARVGDYLLTPVSVPSGYDPGTDLAYLMGVVAGDGCYIRQRRGADRTGEYVLQGLQISCNVDDPHLTKLSTVIDTLAERPHREYEDGDTARSIRVYDQELASTVLAAVGEYSSGKRLVKGVFASQESRLAFLGGLIDSDGHFDKTKGTIRILTASKQLAMDAWQTAVSSGIAASVGTQRSTGGFSDTDLWMVHIPSSSATALSAHSEKVQPTDAAPGTAAFFWRGYLCSPICSISAETVEDLIVYNMDVVGDDETYVAGGVAVHNCSICGNPAKRRSDYCDHLTNWMGRLLPDGRRVFAYNDFPRFFDMSRVSTPADRSAWSIRKIASVSLPKSASIEKAMPLQAVAKSVPLKRGKSVDPGLVDFMQKSAAVDLATAEPLPEHVVQKLASAGVEEALRAAICLGVYLRSDEIDKIAGESQLPTPLTLASPQRTLVMALEPYLEKRSMFDPYFSRRVSRFAMHPDLTKTASTTGDDRFRNVLRSLDLEKLAALCAYDPVVRFSLQRNAVDAAFSVYRDTPVPSWLPLMATAV